MHSPDEPAHLNRAYGISTLQFFPQKVNGQVGSELPSAFTDLLVVSSGRLDGDLFVANPQSFSLEQIISISKIKINKNKTVFLDYANMARLSPVSYLPQSLGIFVGLLLTSSVYWILIFGKIFTLIFYTVLGYYSIKSLPFLKWAQVFILLSPMSLSLGASISADAVLIALSALYFSKILQYSFDKEQKIGTKRLALLAVLAFTLALTKQSFLMVLFVLFIPKRQFAVSYLKSLFGIILLPLFAAAAWSLFAVTIMRPLNNSGFSGHLSYIIHHPLGFSLLMLKYAPGFWNFDIVEKMIGVLGWLNVYFHQVFYHFYFIMFLFNLLYSLESAYEKTNLFQKFVPGFVVVLNYVFVCFLMFCLWAPKGQYGHIEIQGRYLIPLILPFSAFCIFLIKPLNTNKILILSNIIFLFCSLIYVVLDLSKTFWVI